MDKKLQLIQHLYEEADEQTKLNELLEDPELKQEFQALSEAKFWLDHSKKEKPSSDALQAVLGMAMNAQPADASSSGSRSSSRRDRDAIPRQRSSRKRMFGITSFAMATLLFAFVGYQFFLSDNALLGPALNQQADQESFSSSPAELADDVAPSAAQKSMERQEAEGRAMVGAQRATESLIQPELEEAASLSGFQAASVAQGDSSMPDWDKADDIMLYRQRIDMLLEQNQDIAWDETAVPLESLRTTQPTDRRLLQAGSPANNN